MKYLSLLLTLLVTTSCISTDSNSTKQPICCNDKNFLSDFKGREKYLIDTLFYEVDNICHRYNNGVLLVLQRKNATTSSSFVIIKEKGNLYMRLKDFVSLDSIRSFPEKYGMSDHADINRLSKVEDVIDFIEKYSIYEISVNHELESIYVDFAKNDKNENTYLYYSPCDLHYKKTHDTTHVCNNSINYVIFSETIDSIDKGWTMRKTKEEMQ